jgi:hypothetical protein
MRVYSLVSFFMLSMLAAYSQGVIGDWMRVPDKGDIYSNHIGFRFSADSLWDLTNGGRMNYGKYQIRDNILSFSNLQNVVVSYKINLSKDSLYLTSASGSVNKYYSRKLEHDPSLSFEKIVFERRLDDEDRRTTMTVRRNGKAEFKEKRNNKMSRRRFKIEEKRINEIDSAFKWSYIEHIDTTIYYSASFGSPCTLTVTYNRNKVTTIKGTLFHLPLRLKGITWYLLNEMRKRRLG